MSSTHPTIAYFITPHGFGHAARAAAVMNALLRQLPHLRFDIFTKVPAWFFRDSLADPAQERFRHHDLLTDIGLVQANSLSEDLPATLDRLDDFLPFDSSLVETLAREVQRRSARLVLCDIAPLGIAVAHRAGVPALLIENFTWDWIYEGYLGERTSREQRRRLQRHSDYLQNLFARADLRIQTEPICAPVAHGIAVEPVSREPRTPAAQVRAELRIPPDARLALITMGGMSWDYAFLEQLLELRSTWFLIPSGADSPRRRHNVILLPPRSGWYHPDLINASDVVVTKLGYSTLAEVHRAGPALGYIPRQRFRESPHLEAFVQKHMVALSIPEEQFASGAWLAQLPELLTLPRQRPAAANGADQIANIVISQLTSAVDNRPPTVDND